MTTTTQHQISAHYASLPAVNCAGYPVSAMYEKASAGGRKFVHLGKCPDGVTIVKVFNITTLSGIATLPAKSTVVMTDSNSATCTLEVTTS